MLGNNQLFLGVSGIINVYLPKQKGVGDVPGRVCPLGIHVPLPDQNSAADFVRGVAAVNCHPSRAALDCRQGRYQ